MNTTVTNIPAGTLVRLNEKERNRAKDYRLAQVKGPCNDEGGVRLSFPLGGCHFWHSSDLEIVEDNMARVGDTAYSRAEAEFDTDRPLDLSRGDYDHDYKRVYIYSPAVDGVNRIRVGSIDIANVCGLNEDQIKFLTNKIADAIVEAVNA